MWYLESARERTICGVSHAHPLENVHTYTGPPLHAHELWCASRLSDLAQVSSSKCERKWQDYEMSECYDVMNVCGVVLLMLCALTVSRHVKWPKFGWRAQIVKCVTFFTPVVQSRNAHRNAIEGTSNQYYQMCLVVWINYFWSKNYHSNESFW